MKVLEEGERVAVALSGEDQVLPLVVFSDMEVEAGIDTTQGDEERVHDGFAGRVKQRGVGTPELLPEKLNGIHA